MLLKSPLRALVAAMCVLLPAIQAIGQDATPDAIAFPVHVHGDIGHWPVVPKPDDFSFVGYAEPEEARGTADYQTISFSDDAFGINTQPGDRFGWTLFTSHVKHGNDAVWCSPIPRELSADPDKPTRLVRMSDWFSPVDPALYKEVMAGKPSRDLAYLFHGDKVFQVWTEYYSVSGYSRSTFGIGDRVWLPGVINSNRVYGHMAVHIPERWQAALGGNVLMGSASSNNRGAGSQGHSAVAVTIDFDNLPENKTKLPVRQLIYYPHQTHEMQWWTRQCKPAGGVIVGDWLVMARRKGIGRVTYLNPYPIEMPDGTIIYPRKGDLEGREIIYMLPQGARTSNGKLPDGTPKWSSPKSADESFTLAEPGVVRSDRHVRRPDGTWVPKGTVFPPGTTFGPGWMFDVSIQHTGNGYYSAFDVRRCLTFYHLSDLARVARGEIETWELPFVEWSVVDEGAYRATNTWPWPDQLQLDQFGRLVIADRYTQGQRPHLTVYDISDRLREQGDVPDLGPLPDPEADPEAEPIEGPVEGAIAMDNTAAVLTGEWKASSFTEGFAGTDYLHDDNAGKGGKTATYTLDGVEGPAVVYVRWTSGENRASNTPITITHADGDTIVHVDQREHGGEWVSVGTYTFAGEAVIVIGTGGTDGHVIADAVAVVEITDAPEPDPDPDPGSDAEARLEAVEAEVGQAMQALAELRAQVNAMLADIEANRADVDDVTRRLEGTTVAVPD